MSLFLDAANAWNQLLSKSYNIIIGHKQESRTIDLNFQIADFDHLSGIQHATDVDFKLPRKQYRGNNLIPALIDLKLDSTLIEKSENWQSISQRLQAIIQLENILDSDFRIYSFDPHKLNFHTTIKAAYCIFSEDHQSGVFLFVDKEDKRFFCKSIFQKDNRNFISNQTPWTVLKKTKFVNGTLLNLYIHKSYKDHLSEFK